MGARKEVLARCRYAADMVMHISCKNSVLKKSLCSRPIEHAPFLSYFVIMRGKLTVLRCAPHMLDMLVWASEVMD